MEFNEDRRGELRFWDHTFPQAEFAYNNMAHDSTRFFSYAEVVDFVEKSNKDKAVSNKKRRETFEKEDMKIMYLGREIISIERVPTMQLYPNWSSRTSSFEESGTDVGREPMQQANFEPQLSTINISCRQPNFAVDR